MALALLISNVFFGGLDKSRSFIMCVKSPSSVFTDGVFGLRSIEYGDTVCNGCIDEDSSKEFEDMSSS